MNRKDTLQAALNCVMGERERDYGTPENNFGTISDMWKVYLRNKCVSEGADVEIGAEDVAAMLIMVKLARISSGHSKEDNWVDIAGYAACGCEIESGDAGDQ